MADHYELPVSTRDAEARMVPRAKLPADRIAMNTRVSYEEDDSGARRSVMLVHPRKANPGAGRISVLSPVGRALLGRRPGSTVAAAIPGGRALKLRILSAERWS